jgi:hypothetical protein
MALRRPLSAFILVLLSLSFVSLLAFPLQPVHASVGSDCTSGDYGTGADGNVVISVSAVLTGDKNYHNLTINAGITLTTAGYTVNVCGVFSNSGTLFSGSSGTAGGGGSGGSTATCTIETGANGNPGGSGSSGTGGAGNGGGGGGSGACTAGNAAQIMYGGAGGAGGAGGRAGASFSLNTYATDNAGVVTAHGAAGSDGSTGTGGSGGSGCAGSVHCAAGGGGGGGGGQGGQGGSITWHYDVALGSGLGSYNAYGGSAGSGAGYAGGVSNGSGCASETGGSGGYNNGGTGQSILASCSLTGATNGSSGSAGSSGTVTITQIVRVTQPITIATPAGVSAFTYTVSGCHPSATTGTSGASPTSFTVDGTCSLTITMPGPSSNTRPVFASNSTTYAFTTCASGTCADPAPPDYGQLQNTYKMTPTSPSTWDAAYTEQVTGTVSGTPGSIGCYVRPASGGGAASYSCWFDYGKPVSLVGIFTATGASHGTWYNASARTFTDTTGGGTHNVNYAFSAVAVPLSNTFAVVQAVSSAFSGASCAATISSSTPGDLMVVTAGEFNSGTLGFNLPTDTLVSNWYSLKSQTASSTEAQIWAAYVTGTATEVITVTALSAPNGGVCAAYEIEGLQSYILFTASGSGSTGTSLSTSSLAFTGSPYIAIAALSSTASVTWTAGSGFTKLAGTGDANSEYSTSVSSPTTFPASQGTSTTWADVGVVFSRGRSGSNLYLQDSTTGLPFPIGGYAGSTAEVDYSCQSCAPTFYRLNMSQTVVDLQGASRIKVWVGQYYFDSVVPAAEPSPSNVTVYLSPPSIVGSYVVAVQDLSGFFGAGSLLKLSRGSQVFFSGYTDATDTLGVNDPSGTYSLSVGSGPNVHVTNVSLPANAPSGAEIQVQILKLTVSANCMGCTTGLNAGFDSSLQDLLIAFNDSAVTTTSVTDTVQVRNSSGLFTYYTRTWNGSPKFGYFQDTVPCHSDACNSTIAGELTVTVAYTDTWGTFVQNLPVTGSGIFASVPVIPPCLLGLCRLVGSGPDAPTWLGLFSYFVVLIAASVFGALSAKFGVIPVSVLTAVFVYAGWLPMVNGAGTFLIAMAIMAWIGFLQHGK